MTATPPSRARSGKLPWSAPQITDMTPRQHDNYYFAEKLASEGIAVFPCKNRPGAPDHRIPRVKWRDGSTTDIKMIDAWWNKWPNALPYIDLSKCGLIVLDGDRHANGEGKIEHDGVAALHALLAEHGVDPLAVPTIITPNGGRHLYFRHPAGEPIGSSQGKPRPGKPCKLRPGIDVIGARSAAMAPGAQLSDGRKYTRDKQTPNFYTAWREGKIPVLPDSIAELLRNGHREDEPITLEPKYPSPRFTGDKRGTAYAAGTLDSIAHKLAGLTDGRNAATNSAAFRMGTMVARGWIDRTAAFHALLQASLANGYVKKRGQKAVRQILESGLDAGEKQPHAELEDRDNPPRASQSKAQQSAEQHEPARAWDDPDWSILEDRRGELPEFPIDALGPAWQEWIERAAHGAGVTAAHVAIPLLAIASGLIGTGRRVQASRSWSQPLTLWAALVGFSGSGKTPGIDATKRAIALIERDRKLKVAELQRTHERRSEEAKSARVKWQQDVKTAVDGGRIAPPKPAIADDPGPFVAPRLYVSDATIERLAVLLQARPQGMLMICDELASLFLNMSRYSGGQDNEFWLEAWNGNPYTVERMNRSPLMLDHLLIGIVGGLQPDKLGRSFKGDADGMYARVLFAWPAEPPYRPLTDTVAEVEPEILGALHRLIDLDGGQDRDGGFAPRAIALSADAIGRFEQFRKYMHAGKEALDGREREWWAKTQANVLRLAGTLAYLDWGMIAGPEPQHIEAQFLDAAVRIVRDYFWPHARASLRQIGLSERHANARKVLRWIKGNDQAEISVKDIRRNALSHSLDADQAENLLTSLVKAGWLRKSAAAVGPLGGRPAHRWQVNPVLHENPHN
jgi:hypothetical protein